eukprot:TRINITY_DN15223_c0_g1_i2.p1 TRINITY_DN15223_c0_g1~~TRINITY_DN15223_c0_g1_i2.p1  ORF type:complete len:688 (+),score=204.31 TRINITY_DN15223_c0_g1_i2:111-2174(+)
MQKQSPIVSMLIKGSYLLVLRDTLINVYDLISFIKVQDIAIGKEEYPKHIFESAEKIIVLLDLPPQKSEHLSKLVCLEEIPADKKIQALLSEYKLTEARRAFARSMQADDPQYAEKKGRFNVEVGWTLFMAFRFGEAEEWLASANYDPFEFAALIPGRVQKEGVELKSIKDVVKEKYGDEEAKCNQAIEAVMKLLELKRQVLAEEYKVHRSAGKVLTFLHPSNGLNETFKDNRVSFIETITMLDTLLVKSYIKNGHLKQLKNFFDSIDTFYCDYERFESYLKRHLKDDKSETCYLASICFYEKKEKYTEALDLCIKLLQSENTKATEITCKIMVRILTTKLFDASLIFKYVEKLLERHPKKGIQVLLDNDYIKRNISTNEILDHLSKLPGENKIIMEDYLEMLVTKKDTDEKWHTKLALFYTSKIQELSKNKENKDEVAKYKGKLGKLLAASSKYNATEILPAINELGMVKEELIVYSKKKMHERALNLLVREGKEAINFKKAEEYCLMQEEPQLGLLFVKIMAIYKGLENAQKSRKETEEDLTEKINAYDKYCKDYLIRYSNNEKMDIEAAISVLPDDWLFQEDDELTAKLIAAINGKLGTADNSDIELNLTKMEKLNLQAELFNLQKAYVVVKQETRCGGCKKNVSSAKSMFTYPNGVLAHVNCAKDKHTCPETNYNFAKNIINY